MLANTYFYIFDDNHFYFLKVLMEYFSVVDKHGFEAHIDFCKPSDDSTDKSKS